MSTHRSVDSEFQGRILALTGGVGGAKLARSRAVNSLLLQIPQMILITGACEYVQILIRSCMP